MEYLYIREWDNVGSCWLVENPQRIDINGHQIYLSSEVKEDVAVVPFTMICDQAMLKFIFNDPLTPNQKTELDTTIYDHQHNI
jgi:hypothetical protein